MAPESLDQETTNIIGAIIFIAYILAALYLTALLSRDLINAFLYLPKSLRNRNGLHTQLLTFVSLAIGSFSVLSYHLLDYLIESYQDWATDRSIELPYRLYGKKGLFGPGHQRTPLYIWTWLKTSTLFQSFAQTICESGEHFWWTQQALLMTMAWSFFMSVEGPKRRIPHLWAYAILSQVLPISFSQNLFFLAMLFHPNPKPAKSVWTPSSTIQIPPLIVFFILLATAPYAINTRFFTAIIAMIRILLLWPLLSTTTLSHNLSKHSTPQATHDSTTTIYTIIAIAAVYLICIQTLVTLVYNGFNLVGIIRAINNDPSVSALGYDYILGLASAGTWYVTVGSPLE